MKKLYDELTFGDAVNVLARITKHINVHVSFCDGGYVLNSAPEKNNRKCSAVSFTIDADTQNPVDHAIRDYYSDCDCDIWVCNSTFADVEVYVGLETQF